MVQRGHETRKGMADQVYELLQGRILDMEFMPGQRLVIDQLARELGMSPTPVRDALSRMAAERLIKFEAYRGFTTLPPPDAEEIRQSFEARQAIESFAARVGVTRSTTEQVDELERQAARVADRTYAGDFTSYVHFVRENGRFHRLIIATSGNDLLMDAYRQLSHDMLIARTLHGQGVPAIDEVNTEHLAIVDAFRRRDPEAAGQAVDGHVELGRNRILVARLREHSRRTDPSAFTSPVGTS